jgi:DNA polymerase-4
MPLCDTVSRQARREGVGGRTVTLKLKTAAFRSLTRSRTLPAPTQTSRLISQAALDLLRLEVDGRQSYRLIGVGLSGLMDVAQTDRDLFDERETRARTAETTIDRLRERFGDKALISGRALRAGRQRDGAVGPPANDPDRGR